MKNYWHMINESENKAKLGQIHKRWINFASSCQKKKKQTTSIHSKIRTKIYVPISLEYLYKCTSSSTNNTIRFMHNAFNTHSPVRSCSVRLKNRNWKCHSTAETIIPSCRPSVLYTKRNLHGCVVTAHSHSIQQQQQQKTSHRSFSLSSFRFVLLRALFPLHMLQNIHTHTHGQCVQYIHNNKKAGRTLICFDVIRFAIQSLHRHIFELKCEWTMFQATYNIAMFFFFEFIATISLCFPLFIAQTLAVSLFHCRIFTIHSWCKVVWMWVNAFRFMVGAILTI